MRKSLFLFIFIFFTANIFPHPHLFIKPDVRIVFDKEMITGVEMLWEWDKWWSNDVIAGCDLNSNGVFEKDEVGYIYSDFFIGIKDFGFFTIVSVNGKKYKIKDITKFNAVNKNNIVSYSFTIPLAIPKTANDTVSVIFNDETIYTAFDTKNAAVKNQPDEILSLKLKSYSYYGLEMIIELSTK